MQQEQVRLTKQGVRDLNPKGYNGRPASCSHFRNPEIATRLESRLRTITTDTEIGPYTREKLVPVHVCVLCGEERFCERDD